MNKFSNVKIVAFDLDGTLTQHKEKLTDENKSVLDNLAKKYKFLMVGAGQCMRIFNQLNCYSLDIIGNYGMQYCKYNENSKSLDFIEDNAVSCDKNSVSERIMQLRKKYNFLNYVGESVEFHPSGVVTFALLGTKATQEDKLAFDPDRKIRRKIYDEVCKVFNDYNVFIGGSSSFDMAPKPYDKYYALKQYADENNLTFENIVYVGDDYGLGGNDESVFKSKFLTLQIDDYRTLKNVVSSLFCSY